MTLEDFEEKGYIWIFWVKSSDSYICHLFRDGKYYISAGFNNDFGIPNQYPDDDLFLRNLKYVIENNLTCVVNKELFNDTNS